MKKLIGLALIALLCGCTSNPTTANPTVTQTLTLSSSTPGLTGSGTFIDITTNTSTPFTISGLPYSFYFQTGKHDTVEFKVTFNTQCTFNYSLGSTQSSATTDVNGGYTSSQITF